MAIQSVELMTLELAGAMPDLKGEVTMGDGRS
jgi:hypothetical protein